MKQSTVNSTTCTQFILLVFAALLFASCEKEVKVDLNTGESRIVVDGFIENGSYPVVLLTKSIGYFSTIDLATLENSFVHNAVIKVSDGVKTITLKEYSLDTGVNSLNKFYLYSIDTADAAALSFTGQIEHYYTINIEVESKTYSSITKIPNVRPVDSIWFRKPAGKPKYEDSRLMYVRFTDPDTLGNYLRYFTRRNSEIFYPGFNSVYEDDIVNGTTIDSLNLPPGFNRAKNPNLDSVSYFFKGDTVTLRWCAIDKASFNFYSTFEYATGTIGNPFAAPVNVQTNIRGGALGIWAGYGATYISRVVP